MNGCWLYNPIKYGLKLRHVDLPDGGNQSIVNSFFMIVGSANQADAAIRFESGGGLKLNNVKINGGANNRFTYGLDVNVTTGVQTSVLLASNSSIEGIATAGVNIKSNAAPSNYNQIILNGLQISLYNTTGGRAIIANATTSGDLDYMVIGDCVFRSNGGSPAAEAISLTNINHVKACGNVIQGFTDLILQSGCSDIDTCGGGGSDIAVYDDGILRDAAITGLDFLGGLDVAMSGDIACISLNLTGTSTYVLAGIPSLLTGDYWIVPSLLYATGSLSIFINGVSQIKDTDYQEQYASSGTYKLLGSPPTGSVYFAIWGVPTSQGGGGGTSNVIIAEYESTDGMSIPNITSTILDFNYLIYDTHSYVATGADWKFQPATPGYYAVSAKMAFVATTSWALGEYAGMYLWKNGSTFVQLARKDNYTNTSMIMDLVGGTPSVYLNGSTDYLQISIYQTSGGALTLRTGTSYNWISIYKIN
jgi:hypothetical protein